MTACSSGLAIRAFYPRFPETRWNAPALLELDDHDRGVTATGRVTVTRRVTT